MNVKAAYLLLRFPCLTETFVAEEMQKIQSAGVMPSIYSLLKPKKGLVHPVSQALLPLVQVVPGLLHPALWAAQLFFLFKSPGSYFGSLVELMRQPAPAASFRLKRLVVFLKSVWVARDVLRHPVGLVHTHFAWLSAGGSRVVSRLVGVPFSVTTHAFDIYSQKNDLLPLALQHAAKVITISEANKKAMLSMHPDTLSDKIQVIRCGIDLGYFRQEQPNHKPAQGLLKITSVGSLIEKKGHEYLIRACAALKARGVAVDCRIAGVGMLRQGLQALIRDLSLEESVILEGPRPQGWIKERLNQSDVFVLACVKDTSGESDGIPVALMEAMAMGVPVVSTPVSGIPELVRHESTGLLVPERDPAGLADAILRLVQDDGLRARLVEAARQGIEQEYNVADNAARLSRLFEAVVKEGV